MALALVMGAASCGGGDDEDAADEVRDEVEEDIQDEVDEVIEDAVEDGEDGDSEGGELPDFENFEECLELTSAYGSLRLGLVGGSLTGEEVDLEAVLADVEEIAEAAPEDVADDFDTVIEAYQSVFEDLGGDLSAFDFTDPDTAEALEPLSEESFEDANSAVEDYLNELCTG